MKAWKFVRADLKLCHDETKSWKVGKTQVVKTPLILCESGLHASVKALDALQYASSERVRLALVEVSGKIIEGDDKLCAEEMTPLYIASKKSTQRALRLFACRCARKALKLVKNPDPRSVKAVEVSEAYANGKATQAELDTAWAAAGDARDAAGAAAWDAAGDARDAAGAAAWAAAWAAARDAARAAWDAAWDAARDAARAAGKDQEKDLTRTFKELTRKR